MGPLYFRRRPSEWHPPTLRDRGCEPRYVGGKYIVNTGQIKPWGSGERKRDTLAHFLSLLVF